MSAKGLCGSILNFVLIILLASCSQKGPSVPPSEQFLGDFQALTDAVAASSGYSKDAVELTGSTVRIRVTIRDANLATTDQTKREQIASSIVAAAEPVMTARADLAGVQAVSVAILHSTAESSAAGDWHVEDVLDFRKAPNGHFVLHGST